MNPGDIWRLDDGSLRLVVSHATYNRSNLGRVITVVVGGSSGGLDPFAVLTEAGTVHPDRIAMHPRDWLKELVARVRAEQLAEIRTHLAYLLG